jgi:ATP-dependent exoDNAse (exonuclease V) alpha subunit
MDKNQKKKALEELEAIEKRIHDEVPGVNPADYIATAEDLPDFNNLELHDYKNQLHEIQEDSDKVIDNLAKMYLGDSISQHPYLADKVRKDADYYAKLHFLVETSERSLINLNKQIDQGDANPRMYEVLSLLQKEMRENIKLSATNLVNIENFYKNIREDLGIGSVTAAAEESESGGEIIDMKSLNMKLDSILLKKDIKSNLG